MSAVLNCFSYSNVVLYGFNVNNASCFYPRNPYLKGRLSTFKILALTSLHQFIFILKLLVIFVTKQSTLMRRSIVPSLSLQLAFPFFIPTSCCVRKRLHLRSVQPYPTAAMAVLALATLSEVTRKEPNLYMLHCPRWLRQVLRAVFANVNDP